MPTGQFDPPLTTRLGEEATNRRAAESLLSHQSTKAHCKDKQSVWKPVFAQPQISEDSFVLKKVIGTVSRELEMIWCNVRKSQRFSKVVFMSLNVRSSGEATIPVSQWPPNDVTFLTPNENPILPF